MQKLPSQKYDQQEKIKRNQKWKIQRLRSAMGNKRKSALGKRKIYLKISNGK